VAEAERRRPDRLHRQAPRRLGGGRNPAAGMDGVRPHPPWPVLPLRPDHVQQRNPAPSSHSPATPRWTAPWTAGRCLRRCAADNPDTATT
jgi:hypothetical protein